MCQIFISDIIFEQQLFKVSVQNRDIRGQTTFKLKEEYVCWFEPMLYYHPEAHSEIFKVYEHHKKEKRMNIVLGDYQDNYKYATNVNETIMKNLAKSSMVKIVISLLNHWLSKSIIRPQIEFSKNLTIHEIHMKFSQQKYKFEEIP